MAQGAGDGVRVGVEADQFHAPLDPDAAAGEVVDQDLLGVGLGDEQQERIGGVVKAEVEQPDADDAAASVEVDPDRVVAPRDQLLGNPEAAQDLQGPRLDGQRARLLHPVQLPIDDANGRPERRELGGQGEPGRPGPDDQDVEAGRRWGSSRQRGPGGKAAARRSPSEGDPSEAPTGSHNDRRPHLRPWAGEGLAADDRQAGLGRRPRQPLLRPLPRSGEAPPGERLGRPSAQPAGSGDGQAEGRTGDGQGQADQWERQPRAGQLVLPWRQCVDRRRGDPGQPDQRPGGQQAQRDPARLDRGQLGPERGGDGGWVAELGNRCRCGLRGEHPCPWWVSRASMSPSRSSSATATRAAGGPVSWAVTAAR